MDSSDHGRERKISSVFADVPTKFDSSTAASELTNQDLTASGFLTEWHKLLSVKGLELESPDV